MCEASQAEHLPVGQTETLQVSVAFDLILSQLCRVQDFTGEETLTAIGQKHLLACCSTSHPTAVKLWSSIYSVCVCVFFLH